MVPTFLVVETRWKKNYGFITEVVTGFCTDFIDKIGVDCSGKKCELESGTQIHTPGTDMYQDAKMYSYILLYLVFQIHRTTRYQSGSLRVCMHTAGWLTMDR